jgi:TonB family protein
MTNAKNVKRNTFLKYGLLVMAMVTMLFSASAQAPIPGPPDFKNATPDADGVYGFVEHLPSFPGGTPEFSAFLKQNIKYPAADKEKNITGKVIVQFVVGTDGVLTNIKAIRSPSDAMTQEAIRVLNSSPKWVPATQNGKVVKARYTVPIDFKPS